MHCKYFLKKNTTVPFFGLQQKQQVSDMENFSICYCRSFLKVHRATKLLLGTFFCSLWRPSQWATMIHRHYFRRARRTRCRPHKKVKKILKIDRRRHNSVSQPRKGEINYVFSSFFTGQLTTREASKMMGMMNPMGEISIYLFINLFAKPIEIGHYSFHIQTISQNYKLYSTVAAARILCILFFIFVEKI